MERLASWLNVRAIRKSALIGAVIGFLVITVFFVVGGGWELTFRVWFPTLTVTIGGLSGGIFYGLMYFIRRKGGWIMVFINILSVIVFVIALWLSSVAGFAVTGDWN
ncbi:potassium transporter KefB [Fulvivirga maritima]|uniref:potassium transporter KefB n=1 Tax=Fulvivirga maritima TaxID=2904247 RepID=UPI001F2E79F9|nr:potassium transporter KefB [Fulvivirga maritima]UII24731.1 potassium transporter KefB [Fulvivirga maritima]